jgi:hypothetical protein
MLAFALAGEKSLIGELWDYFSGKYSVEMPYLENFKIETNALFSFNLIIVGITIGIIVASIGTLYNKRYIGDFVRKVISEGCLDAKSAKTLYELGYLKDIGIRNVIKSGGTLSRWVRCVEEDEFLASVEIKRAEFDEQHKGESKPPKFVEPMFKRDLNTMHFYIPEDKKYAAEVKFEKAGNSPAAVFLVAIVAVILCVFICYILPDTIKLVDNFISVMKGNR